MTALYEFQADFETATYGLRDAATARRPDAVSIDFLTAWCTGPKAIGDTVSEGPESRLWRARVLVQGEVLLVRSSLARDQWLSSEEYVAVTYGAAYPIQELAVGFTVFGDLVIVAQRPTGPSGGPEIWVASTNPYLS